MSQFDLKTQKNRIDINSRWSIVTAILLGVIGPAVFIVQPGFVQGLVGSYHFDEQQVGYIASAEMWGIALTTLFITFISRRFSWRLLLVLGILLSSAGNLLSTITGDATSFAILRCLTGVGSGVLISLSFTVIGLTAKPDRNFGWLIMWVLIYGALGFLAMPSAYELVGMKGVLVFFALFNLLALPFVRFFPVSGENHVMTDERAVTLPPLYRSLAVVAMLFYFVAQGAVWAYLFLIGTSNGVTEDNVSYGLTLSQFFGIVGALAAAAITCRFGRLTPLALGLLASILSLMALMGDIGPFTYMIAVCLFNLAWNNTHPYLLAALASFDRSGRTVERGVAAQMIGLAIGPAIAANVIADDNYSNVIWLGIALFAAALVAIVGPVLKQSSVQRGLDNGLTMDLVPERDV
ncbi:MFS transporter [Pseudomonas plecoglossicida]|uniref:MFS transporter n=1 Tax=Pseudomonas plecoglossicida TaxID=70775 RepID=UPI003D1C9551